MLPVDGSFLYQTGKAVAPLNALNAQMPMADCWLGILIAHQSLDLLINQSVYRPTTSRQEGLALLETLNRIGHRPIDKDKDGRDPVLGWSDHNAIASQLAQFEAVFAAEIRPSLHMVTSTLGLDANKLIADGSVAFPKSLKDKVPTAIPDCREAMKCIVFELPTAAGFHLHRANESVMRKYYEAVVPAGNAPPDTRNIGDYINALSKLDAGDKRVRAALRDLKDLHRNPLIHPETSLEDTDEAYALYCGVFAAMQEMLKVIPNPSRLPISSYFNNPPPPAPESSA